MFGIIKKQENRVLVVADLHLPFEKEGYLEFCIRQYKKWKCNKVIFIGDIIDNHYSSYHDQDPDGLSAGHELDLTIKKVSKWYKAFPEAIVIIGNHDRIISRKIFSSGLSKKWMKSYQEVLKVDNWNFLMEYELDNTLYFHGEAGGAVAKAKQECKSVIQGHRHSEGYVQYINNDVFGMQVGTGIDRNSYAMAYGSAGKKPIISCGIVIAGREAYLVKMNDKK
jgi:metallophosphoesterase superfamily enzyme